MLITVKVQQNSGYEVTWYVGDNVFSYSVGMEDLSKVAGAVREQLRQLSLCSNGEIDTPRREILVALAEAGQELRYSLFNDPQKKDQAGILDDYIAQTIPTDRQLVIHADVTIDLPWGLMFDGDVPPREGSPDSDEMAEFSGFWCLKYRLSTMPGPNPRAPKKWKRPRSGFGMLSLVNREVKEKLADDLPPDMYEEFCEMLKPPVGEPDNYRHGLKLMEDTPNADVIVHFLGHHQNQTLILDDGYEISFNQFSRLLDELTGREQFRASQPCGLVFLNGCESAVGEKDLTLRRHVWRPQFCGVIATESIVRRQYAAVFGIRFLRLMTKEGRTVADTMEELHHDRALWPESLIYGCYAHPDFCIEPPANDVPAQPKAAALA